MVKTDEGAQSRHIPYFFLHGEQGLQGFEGHHREISRVFHVLESGDVSEKQVKQEGVEGALVLSFSSGSFAANDVEALFADFTVHLGQQFGRILEIAVHHGDDLSFRVFESGGEGRLVTEVLGEGDDLDVFVVQPVFQEVTNGIVGAAIVNKEEFIVVREGFHGGHDSVNQIIDQLCFVVYGDDQAEHSESFFEATQRNAVPL